jgi:hypothetical protein
MAVQGPEVWTIDAQQYKIDATYYLTLPEGLQYTIDYELPTSVKLPHEAEAALAIAFPLIRYAYEHQLHQRTNISKSGSGEVGASRIGVALYHVEGVHRRGYAAALSLDQIRQRIASGGAKSSNR